MHLSALHHVEMSVANGKKMASYFIEKLGFSLRAQRDTLLSKQWVVGSQKSTFIVTEKKNNGHCLNAFVPFSYFTAPVRHIDSVFNVALEVRNLESVTERMQNFGGKLFHPVTEVEDNRGKVRYSIVSSCCGNIVHTLLDKSQYKGSFLPTFDESFTARGDEKITHIDHLTYVCRSGESQNIITWYQNCLGMTKFKTSPTEDLKEGLVIKDGIGMRLRVMDYWPCAESGIFNSNPNGMDETSLKIVVAESLPEIENSHIRSFLDGHGGPGLQHIGLSTLDIVDSVDTMSRKNVLFRTPPAAYYRNKWKRYEIETAGCDLKKFQQLGILIDSEADTSKLDNQNKFLLQIFTLPLFKEETFFFEVIQRKGARGFGSGNITALARSIEEEQLVLKNKNVSII